VLCGDEEKKLGNDTQGMRNTVRSETNLVFHAKALIKRIENEKGVRRFVLENKEERKFQKLIEEEG